ncbi:hypothetical protein, partial [Treponema berlinense]|uniref:hypothetical protein n=1 Tax=Treponema berlinense TaxID=225004 RepID=UPI002A81B800
LRSQIIHLQFHKLFFSVLGFYLSYGSDAFFYLLTNVRNYDFSVFKNFYEFTNIFFFKIISLQIVE